MSATGGDERAFDTVPVPADLPPGWSVTTASGVLVARAEQLEYRIFHAAGFCDESADRRVAEFEPWRDASSFKVVLSGTGEVRGAVRTLIGNYDRLPVGKFERSSPYPGDPVLEYASLAVPITERGAGVAEALYRAVWQDALRSGVEGLVAIGEDWLLRILNGVYGFGFEQLGPSEWYMGGDCFPMGTGMRELTDRLTRQPSFFRWVSAEIDLRDLPSPATREAVRQLREGPGPEPVAPR
jgi:hypothetical protein